MTPTPSALHQRQIDQPLPSEVSLQSDTWLTRARNYPVFSRTWYRYRMQACFGVLIPTLLFCALIGLMINSDMRKFLTAAIPITISFFSLHLVGTLAAVWVRQRNYREKKEVVLLILALLLGAAFSYGVFNGTRYATKYVAYGDGNITIYLDANAKIDTDKEHPKNKPASTSSAFSAGVSDGAAAGAASATTGKPKESSDRISNSSTIMAGDIVGNLTAAGFLIYAGGGVDLWLFFRQRKRLVEALRLQELRREQEARREAELRLSVLVAQVEPHFLFNTLAGVRSAILTEPGRATAIVDHLVDYLRATIPQMRNDGSAEQARLSKQLEAVRAYLSLMQARIPRLSFSVESDVVDAALPPLMLISLVENAIKHGIEPKIGPAHITVTAKVIAHEDDKEYLELSVADNGVGFGGTTSGSGIGLANIQERLQSMYGKHASLTLKAGPEGGVIASIVLPLSA
ncbi:histidine kinase [Undibacterium sp. RTI2.1]|uniref:sensor histidine kinase n=1 Tax=unclassified Undibacterium TaxID=2630295 RepID=UPI002B22C116|nr:MULTISPECIES: histidine kinase [unclassified Undibacterium]MEB0030174.1 histidine kinase [Undibacterium sp. RTI2.1]MEB0116702.1 histidine kinase [Undibacterium sp. RTI2.2]